jgi:Leucine-rich repeat (LRR) protein
MSYNQIVDITPLRNLEHLSALYIDNNAIQRLPEFAANWQLGYFECVANPFSSHLSKNYREPNTQIAIYSLLAFQVAQSKD